MIGETFGELTVLSVDNGTAHCRCSCGAKVSRSAENLGKSRQQGIRSMCAKCKRRRARFDCRRRPL